MLLSFNITYLKNLGQGVYNHLMELIKVKVIPNAKKNEITQEEDHFKARVKAPVVKGKANKELIALLADFFDVKKSVIKIVKGAKSREKLVEIGDDG